MIKKRFLAILGTSLVGAMLLAACGNSKSATDSKQQEINVATTAEMSTLNTVKYSDTSSLEALQNSFEGSYRFNAKNKPVLAGAQSVKVSADKKVYTFTLRKNAKWSNGDPVVASDYVYAWRKMSILNRLHLIHNAFCLLKMGSRQLVGNYLSTN